MILIGIGANLPSANANRLQTCEAALCALRGQDIAVLRRSRWYESAPEPASAQPWYVNGVAELQTKIDPPALLDALHRIEARFGRDGAGRRRKNAARTLDLDLLCYHQHLAPAPARPVLPHPRMHLRAFVLLPLRELAPAWRHPGSGASIDDLIAGLPPQSTARPIA
ncbi:MAG: 2-amino-4-hydroxy-6-hydroxymethyldihydropteridine diphosphokinase [Alphaproteobacteria bacterium]